MSRPAKLKLRMADGSIISVASGTQMTIRAYAVDAAGQRQDATLSLGQGLLRAVVAPVTGPAKFEVDTAVGTAAVRSTDWFVEAFPARDASRCSGRFNRDDQRCHRGSVIIPERWGGAARSRARSGAAARMEPGGVRCGHCPHRGALKRAGLFNRGIAWPRGSREAGLALFIALGVMLGLAYWAPGAFRDLETASLDLRFRIRGARPPGPEIAVVLVDEASLSRLGRWPLSRRLYAKAVEILDQRRRSRHRF